MASPWIAALFASAPPACHASSDEMGALLDVLREQERERQLIPAALVADSDVIALLWRV